MISLLYLATSKDSKDPTLLSLGCINTSLWLLDPAKEDILGRDD